MKSMSIIIPMYNVEPYVERCIRSIEKQDIPEDDFEIICINDGSPDNSKEVVIQLQKEFNNIILINQENQGVSRARNNGIDKACGKYLLFIDPDDFVDPNSFGRILKNIEYHSAQVSFLGFSFLNSDGTTQRQIFNELYSSKIYIGIEAYYIARGDGKTDPDRMCAILFNRDFLNKNHLRYLPHVPYLEDGELIARILCLAERCIFDGHSFYQRTKRRGSATNSRLFNSEKATKGFLLAVNNLAQFREQKNLSKTQKKFLNQPIAKFVLLSVNSCLVWKEKKRLLTTVRKLKSLGLRRIKLAGCARFYMVNGIAYNVSPYLGALSLILYKRINRLFELLTT